MNKKFWQTFPILPLALIGLMALTRFSHFGSPLSLPDASLAVFFLAGISSLSLGFFALLLLEAGIIDYLAITHLSVSDFCISPAYAFLIPTYAVMWFAGGFSRSFKALQLIGSLKIFGLAVFATITAFIISNGSFYLLSGSFGELSWESYLRQSGHYLPSYLSASLVYIVVGLLITNLIKSAKTLSPVET